MKKQKQNQKKLLLRTLNNLVNCGLYFGTALLFCQNTVPSASQKNAAQAEISLPFFVKIADLANSLLNALEIAGQLEYN